MTAFPTKKYKTIYADPPWMERGGGKIKRGADRHYDLMKTKDIVALPVTDLAEDNAHLYLWTTNNFLPDALTVMAAFERDKIRASCHIGLVGKMYIIGNVYDHPELLEVGAP
jgi:N6-adenosine-specific RNA methylase IME4